MRICIICPVRHADEYDQIFLANYVTDLEQRHGHTVHWPPRDMIKDDHGIRIAQNYLNCMRLADEVHVWWPTDRISQGVTFEVGAAFALGKKIVIINDVPAVHTADYQNVLRYMAEK